MYVSMEQENHYLRQKLSIFQITKIIPTLALYAKTGEVLLRITASADSIDECEKLIDAQLKEIEEIRQKKR